MRWVIGKSLEWIGAALCVVGCATMAPGWLVHLLGAVIHDFGIDILYGPPWRWRKNEQRAV